MILDRLENAHRYSDLHPGFAKAFEFLLRPDLAELPANKYELEGDRLYAIIAKDRGRQKEQALLETHEKYIDIQCILSGIDTMGWRPKSSCCHPAGEYASEEDIQFFTDKPETWLAAEPGIFAIFFPEDAHMPLISSGQIHKVIVKVAVHAPL